MDDDRKYRQRGYMDTNGNRREDRPGPERRQRGPRQPLDVTGPRLPRMVQAVEAARCYNCATRLPADTEFSGNCPKCNAALHCCKQCAHFEPGLRNQCSKPVPKRISPKDVANDCPFFESKVTVARDSAHDSPGAAVPAPSPGNARDARAAFDNLFKK